MRFLTFLLFIMLLQKYNCKISIEDTHDLVEVKLMHCDSAMQHGSSMPNQKRTSPCANKLIIEIKADPSSKKETRQFSKKIDHVIDAATGLKVNLPDIIRLDVEFEPAAEVYDLSFKHLVNGEVTEIIADSMQSSFLCGYVIEDEYMMPYSQGFNCSCNDDNENLVSFANQNKGPTITDSDWGMLMRQPYVDSPSVQQLTSVEFLQRREIKSSQSLVGDNDLVSFSLLPSAYDDGTNYNYEELQDDFIANSQSRSFQQQQQYIWNQTHPNIKQTSDRVQEAPTIITGCPEVLQGVSAVYLNFPGQEKRTTFCEQAVLSRGSQQCKRDPRPSNVPNTAHCLRLSQLWYAAYSLRHARVQQKVTVKVFQMKDFIWQELSDVSQRPNPLHLSSYDLFNAERSRLLVPQPVEDVDPTNFPELSNSPHELMILDAEQLSADGRDCNKAGTSFEAFFNQPLHCLSPAGSCVQENQPLQLRHQDELSRQKGQSGKYMLYNFASLPTNPIRKNSESENLQLVVYPLKPRPISIRLDLTLPPVTESLGHAVQLLSVKVDAQAWEHVLFRVTMRAQRAARLLLRVACEVAACPPSPPRGIILSAGETHIEDIVSACSPSPILQFKCIVDVQDAETERAVGSRKVLVNQPSVCECRGPCMCVCSTSDQTSHRLPCVALSDTELRDAGFILDQEPNIVDPFTKENFFSITIIQVLAAVVVFMLFGILKSLFGLVGCKSIELFGLNIFLQQYKQFFKKRSILDWWSRFVLNTFIFLLFPLLFWHWVYYHCSLHVSEARQIARRSEYFDGNESLPITSSHRQNQNYDPRTYRVDEETSYVEEERCTLLDLHQSTESDHIIRHQQKKQECYEMYDISEKSDEDQETQYDEEKQVFPRSNFNELVKLLCKQKFVYRHLGKPLGDINLPPNTQYCVKGFFKHCTNTDFQFLVPPPMFQYWSKKGEEWEPLTEFISLTPSHFSAYYRSDSQVEEDGEILHVKIFHCINEK